MTTTAAITSISPSLTITYALPPGHSGACLQTAYFKAGKVLGTFKDFFSPFNC